MNDLNGLRAWDAARELEKVVGGVARKNRVADPGGVLSQLCRAANCVGASLAEGVGAATKKERLQRFRRAHQEASEIRHHIRSAWDSQFFDKPMYFWLASRAAVNVKMIRNLIVSVERRMSDDKGQKATTRRRQSVPLEDSGQPQKNAKRSSRTRRSRIDEKSK